MDEYYKENNNSATVSFLTKDCNTIINNGVVIKISRHTAKFTSKYD